MDPWIQKPWRRLGLSARAGWLVVGGYGIALVLIAAQYVASWGKADSNPSIDQILLLLSAVSADGCAGGAARGAQGRRRCGWLALAVALGGWAVGEALRLIPEIAHTPYPTPADLVL